MRVLVVTAMYPTPERPAWGTFVKEQVDSLTKMGVEIEVYAFDGNGSARNYLQAGIRLRKLVRAKSYDLIHAHYGLAGGVAVMQSRFPVIITFHGSDLLGEVGVHGNYTLGGKIKTAISRAAALKAARCIVVADLLIPKLWPKPSITIPMGVNLSLFKPIPMTEARGHLGFGRNAHLVLFAANPKNRIKCFELAQEAVILLQASGFDVELLPVFNTPHDQIPWYMNACDALILTSLHEASPCVIKEAMACNLPIVAVDVGDVAERIADVQGCFVCNRTPQDLAAKLGVALESSYRPNSRNKMIDLDLDNIARQILLVYHQVISTDGSI